MDIDSKKYKFGFYAIITDPVLGIIPLAKILVEHQVPYLQLRLKKDSRDKILDYSKAIVELTRGTATKFILNDDPVLTVEAGADGVHLGQEDMSVEQARKILGPSAIIGLSTHNAQQVIRANELSERHESGPDYIGMGPVYATPTKLKPDPVIGLDGLTAMLAVNRLPAVAIGGIDMTNIRDVLSVGAWNLSAVRLINQSQNIDQVLRDLRQMLKW